MSAAGEQRNDFVDLALAQARAGVPVPQIIAELMVAAGMMIAGGAKPGREETLIAQAVGILRNSADTAHAIADRDGIHLAGRDA
jgi:hypothetical protein